MTRARWVGRCLGVLVGTLGLGTSVSPTPARACGGFFASGHLPKAALAHEQVLIIHDPATKQEHFIRKVVFRQARSRFGFVVPTPSRPTVAAVKRNPFWGLSLDFDFDAPPGRWSPAQLFGGGRGVQVLETKKIGSFTSFVLAATDQAALAKWLDENHLTSTKHTDAWLRHYVRLGFYYVALRYDPPEPGRGLDAKLQAETLRISFETPIPFYPYLEPERDRRTAHSPERLLELWLVSPTPLTPIALEERGDVREWVRPLRPGARYENARELLKRRFDPELRALLPAGKLWAQTFQDQKRSRKGFGDILFAPLTANGEHRPPRRALESLLPILDPSLLPPEEP